VTPVDEGHISLRCAVIIAAKGGRLADITVGDVVELFDAEDHLKADPRSRPATFKVFREMGIFGAEVPAWRSLRRTGKLSVEELVDRYPIACRPMRDLLVAYLKERQPSVDYGTVVSLCYSLVRCFWSDLEAHHPGIDRLRLTPEVASAWKGRLRTKKVVARTASGASDERLNYLDVLYTVRAFYLDLAEWALEDPARWGPWVEPCPIRQHELSRRKFVRQRKARMDARTASACPCYPSSCGAHNAGATMPPTYWLLAGWLRPGKPSVLPARALSAPACSGPASRATSGRRTRSAANRNCWTAKKSMHFGPGRS